jgi:hypothetical protein
MHLQSDVLDIAESSNLMLLSAAAVFEQQLNIFAKLQLQSYVLVVLLLVQCHLTDSQCCLYCYCY